MCPAQTAVLRGVAGTEVALPGVCGGTVLAWVCMQGWQQSLEGTQRLAGTSVSLEQSWWEGCSAVLAASQQGWWGQPAPGRCTEVVEVVLESLQPGFSPVAVSLCP